MRLHVALLTLSSLATAAILSDTEALRKGIAIAVTVADNIKAAPPIVVNEDHTVKKMDPKRDPIYTNLAILRTFMTKTMMPSLAPGRNMGKSCDDRKELINGTDSFLSFNEAIIDIYHAMYPRVCADEAQTYDNVMFTILSGKIREVAGDIEKALYNLMEDPADVPDSGSYLLYRNGCNYHDDLESCQIHATQCPDGKFTDAPPDAMHKKDESDEPSEDESEEEEGQKEDEQQVLPCTKCCIKDTCVPKKAAFAVDETGYWAQRYMSRIVEAEFCGHGAPSPWIPDEL